MSAPATAPATAPAAASAETAAPRRKSRRILVVAALAVIALAGGATWHLLSDPTLSDEAQTRDERPGVFVALEPLTVNLQPERSREFLQIGLSVKLAREDAAEALKARMPEVRNAMLLLLASKTSADLLSTSGKQKLAAEVLAELKKPFGASRTAEAIESVLFTSFIIQ
jgi:flagellar FliL protein